MITSSQFLRYVALIVAFALCSRRVNAESEDIRLLEGMIERRLFELAEHYCQQAMQSPQTDVVSQGELARALIRVYAEQERFVLPAMRGELQNKSDEVVRRFQEKYKNNPQVLLVRFQTALARLSRGEVAFEEFARWKQQAATNDIALRALTETVHDLEGLQRDVVTAVRERSRAPNRVGQLSDDQLRLLQGHIEFYLIKAFQLQSESFGVGTPDRILAATSALEHAQRLAPADVSELLWWESRLREIACFRLKEDWSAARQAQSRLEPLAISPVQVLEVRAATIQTALAQDAVDEAIDLVTQGRALDGETSPALDMAHLEAYLYLWQASIRNKEDDQVDQWRNQALKLSETIQSEHGAKWGRLAVLMTADRFGSAGLSDDIQTYFQLAQEFFRHGDWRQAIEAYDQGVVVARQKSLSNAAFDLAYQAAVILHEQGEVADAIPRFRAAACISPEHPRAAETHWVAVRLAATEARRNQDKINEYEAILREHLTTWPTAPSSHNARWWLARVLESRQEWKDAAQLYAAGEGAESDWIIAVERTTYCWEQFLRQQPRNALIDTDLQLALNQLDRVINATEHNVPPLDAVAQQARLGQIQLHVQFATKISEPLIGPFAEQTARLDANVTARNGAAKLAVLMARVRQHNSADARELTAQLQSLPYQMVLPWVTRLAALDDKTTRSLAAETILQLGENWPINDENWSPHDRSAWQSIRARALADSGSLDAALEAYRQWAARAENDENVQIAYGQLLLKSPKQNDHRAALEQWRMIATRSPTGSDPWFEAKYGVAQAHFQLGDPRRAVELIEILRAIHPTLGGKVRKAEFDTLLEKCRQASK